jgi:hypothetical protein
MDKLLAWLVVIDMDPGIIDALQIHLYQTFMQEEVPNTTHSHTITVCITTQQNMGWISFFEGFISSEWQTTQQNYYIAVGSRRSGKRWQQLLMLHLWTIAAKLWEQRNEAKHDRDHSHTAEVSNQLNRKLRCLYHKIIDKLPEQDQYLIITPLQALQAKGIGYKKEWIQHAELALSAQQTRLNQAHQTNERQRNLEALRASRQRTRQMLDQMRSTMQSWLARREDAISGERERHNQY